MQAIHIAPGMTLRHVKTGTFYTRTYTILYRCPLTRGYVTANALIPGVLKRGTRAFPDARALAARAEELYGAVLEASVVKKGEEQLLQFCLETTRDVPEAEAVAFLCGIICRPVAEEGAFRGLYTEAEKGNLARVIAGRQNDKREYARLRCIEEMCNGEPFGLYGDGYAEDLEKITAHTLYAQYEAVLTRSPVEILTVGDMEQEALAALFAKHMHTTRTSIEAIQAADTSRRPRKVRRITEGMAVAQGKLCLGLRAGGTPAGQGYYELMCANAIFGGGADSLLFTHIREKNELCYYVQSVLYRYKSILLIEAGLEPQDFEKAEGLIAEQLTRMKNGAFDADALDKAKRALIKHLQGLNDDPSMLTDFMLSQALAGGEMDTAAAIAGITAVTAKGCARVFGEVALDTCFYLTPQEGGHVYAG